MVELSTSSFKLKYHNGAVRWITCNDTEVISMIYSAIRDCNWGTFEPEVISENIAQDEQGFQKDARFMYRIKFCLFRL